MAKKSATKKEFEKFWRDIAPFEERFKQIKKELYETIERTHERV